MTPTRILIAPNAFKHSLEAPEAALAIQQGFQQSRLTCVCDCFPVGDGGDGTGELMIQKLNGSQITSRVNDPFGNPIDASFGIVNEGQTAVIEMANASGIRLVRADDLNPLKATSFGTGEQIKLALEKGVSKLVLAIGGSATVDGGTGILRALGIRFLDTTGQELATPEQLSDLATIDTSGLDERIRQCEITILCDVDNTLLGPDGSAAVFGPQKGATPQMVQQLDASLARFARIAHQQTGIDMTVLKHGGAAGGVAAGLHTFLNAKLVNGIDFFLEFTNFDQAVSQADLVITGEGSIDEQTLQGKGPYGVAYQAKLRNLPVIGLAGKIPLEPSEQLNDYFDTLLAIGNGPTDLSNALASTRTNLIRVATQLGNLLAQINA
ncbi:glycerate 3-kinase [Spirosoma terrae]|uniref:Glycerate kinase n=1 Tax=Spirosoma terrae TaxID=1968276 RepID=A0A6L9L8C7_9BACT|nr:glycerate kinase [Spirosoma terrae]NDU95391.1 glycerate kinase [Spirosoma terrae]